MKLTLGEPKDTRSIVKDGTEVMHRFQRVFIDDKAVGNVEIHLFVAAEGFGITTVVHVAPIIGEANGNS